MKRAVRLEEHITIPARSHFVHCVSTLFENRPVTSGLDHMRIARRWKLQHVLILFEKPARPFKQIGHVSSLGGWFASDGDNYHKMQMAAAQLGADAVIVQGAQPQSQRDYWQYPKTSGVAIKYTD